MKNKDALDYHMGYYQNETSAMFQMWQNHLNELHRIPADYFLTTSPRTIIALDYWMNTKSGLVAVEKPFQVKEWAVFLSRFLP